MKKSFLRQVIGIVLCIIMVVSSTALAFATDLDMPVAEDPTDEYQYGYNPNASISISGNTINFSSSVHGYKGITTKILGTCSLQKYSGGKWTNVATLAGSTTSLKLTINGSKNELSHGKYRTHATFKVYYGNNCETIAVNSATKNY